MKKLILILTVASILFTLFASFSALATSELPSEYVTDISETAQNPYTGDLLFGLFVIGSLAAIITLYLLMRKKYIK